MASVLVMGEEPGAASHLWAVKDGLEWPIGSGDVAAWINGGTTITKAITAAIPPIFDAYATIELPGQWQQQAEHDAALIDVLSAHSESRSWWLGYLDTGADDIVFPDAPKVSLYADWRYVLVQAGPDQARGWRCGDPETLWKGSLPSLMFPTDHSWLSSTLWDDDWTCVGGSPSLISDLLAHSVLSARSRAVALGENATPPGHQAF